MTNFAIFNKNGSEIIFKFGHLFFYWLQRSSSDNSWSGHVHFMPDAFFYLNLTGTGRTLFLLKTVICAFNCLGNALSLSDKSCNVSWNVVFNTVSLKNNFTVWLNNNIISDLVAKKEIDRESTNLGSAPWNIIQHSSESFNIVRQGSKTR